MNTVEEKVIEILRSVLGIEKETILLTDPVEDYINSMKFIELVVALEAEFDFEFPDDDLGYEE